MSDDESDSLYPLYFGVFGALSLYWIAIPKQKAPDLTGKKVVITGASSGVGKGLTEICAAAGGHVVMAVRDTKAGARIKDNITHKYPNKELSIDVEELDLQSLESIDKFVSTQSDVDVLINNAGILQPKYSLHATKNHLFESTILTNYIGPFYLTMRLLPKLIESAKRKDSHSHIINVSSRLERNANITLSNYKSIFNEKVDNYSCWDSYAQSKLLNILFTVELQKRLPLHDKVIAVAVTPGLVNTSLDRHVNAHPLMRYITHPFKQLFLKSPEYSALAIIKLTELKPSSDADSKIIPYYSDMTAIKPGNKVFQDRSTNEQLAQEIFNHTLDMLRLNK